MRFSLKPVFVTSLTILVQLPIQVFLTIWMGMFFGNLTASFVAVAQGWPWPQIFFGAIGFFAVPLGAIIGKKLTYNRTEYRFYDDRVEFEEGFFTVNKKTIKFSDVKEVTLRQGFLQRLYGLGTIYLATLATGAPTNPQSRGLFGFGNVAASGISLRDIPDADDTYNKVKALVDARARVFARDAAAQAL
jgi:membrane protein YdbS with pleckstrin-like domain